ncbi:MAG: hypothetical protein VB093_17805 [Propionicimonas sp.]|nr:hypothetical protein [Propionicimonas sp.]
MFTILAAAFVGVAWTRPHLLFGAVLLSTLFVRTLEHITANSAVGLIDDVLVVFAVIYGCKERMKGNARVKYPGFGWFLVFFASGIISSVVNGGGINAVAIGGAFLASKFLLIGWAAAQTRWEEDHIRWLIRGGGVTCLVVGLGVLGNLAAPGLWNSVFTVGGGPIVRFGQASLVGPFIHPVDLAFFCGLALLASTSHIALFGSSWKSRAIQLACGMALLLTFRRKEILGTILALGALVMRRRRAGSLWLYVFVILISVLAFLPFISTVVQDLVASYGSVEGGEGRTLLSVGAARLANQYLPLGAGFGRFASRTAAVNYSPEYYQLGLDRVYGLGPGDRGFFLTDTSWPAVLGETGVLGTVAFIVGWCCIFRSFRQVSRDSSDITRFLGDLGVGWVVFLMIESTGAAVFSSPPMFAFVPFLAGLVASLSGETAGRPGHSRPGLVRSLRGAH